MLTLYLVCLAVGGVFVGLSALGGVDKEIDADGQIGFDGDGDLHVGVDGDIDAGTEIALDGDAEVGIHETSLSDASHGGEGARKKRRWLPFLSFRFWTFTSAFFGLTGSLLTWAEISEPLTAILSGLIGATVGTSLSLLIKQLSAPVSSGLTTERALIGQVGELVFPWNPGEVSKVRLELGHGQKELLVRAQENTPLPKGTRVVILDIDKNGHAKVAPEQTLYHLEE